MASNEVLRKNTVEFKNYIRKEILPPAPEIYTFTDPKDGIKKNKYYKKSQVKSQNGIIKDLEIELENFEDKTQNYHTKALDNKNLYIIYLQETGANGKSVATNIRKTLIVSGYNAPGIEHIPQNFVSRITYFYDEDKERAENIFKEVSKLAVRINSSFDVKQLIPKKSNIQSK